MTPRQRLLKSAIRRVRSNNWRDIHHIYETITPDSDDMNRVIEDIASRGDDMLAYYTGLSDRGYYRLANEIFRNS